MMKKILVILCIFWLLSGNFSAVFAANSDQSTPYTQLRTVDLWTFNEFKYKLTEQFFTLRNDFEVLWSIKEATIIEIYKITKDSYNYLPDNLINKNLYEKLEIALAKAAKYSANESIYLELVDALDNYLENVSIKSIKWSVEATPSTGNAPLSTTLRWNVRDESGTQIPAYNYVWWIDDAGKRKVIWNKPSIHYVFREEGTFSVFLDVTSSHKNSKGFTDVLPFRSREDITVKEKVASLIIKVNSDNLRDSDELKFTPDEASYGLIFDATSSTATDGAKFTRTEWDFWNGVERTNDGDPEIERIKFTKEGEYTVSLKLRTNEGKSVERKFTVNVHDPIATVHASQEQWYLGDKFTFSAKPTGSDENLSFDWEIIDIDFDKEIFNKSWKTFTYSFPKKWKYNVKLRVTEPSGEVDVDTKIIYINSRAPVAEYSYRIPNANEPNTVLLDASKSYDLDGIDDGRLNYEWIINGDRVELDRASFNGSVWYYTFDSIESHSVLLRVSDPEGISAQITKKVLIKSILSVDFAAYPRVTQRETPINFQADSPEAKVFAWDFGDGTTIGGRNSNITHKYTQSGIYTVRLQVSDEDDQVNRYEKKVYIWESNRPLAFINIKNTKGNEVGVQPGVCFGENAYIIDRAGSVNFSGAESIDVTWKTSGLTYSWKLGKNKYFSNVSFAQKFDELGCFPVQLTVKSISKGQTDKINTWVKVENLKPTLSSVDVQIVDWDADPVVVKVSALWAKDEDGVIQSYLWYYYTDIDPEPQDFRATKQSNTTFVLPKVTWNYYFVVLMKDNNETRVSSEEITGSKYFITLTGDNINVPLVDLNVNDSSISVGEEVLFTAEVENILWYNLSNKSEYSWDLDGDGFYEQKTNTPSISHTFERSGEFYAKVKAKYKWYSNTKSITMNVSNLLKPDIDYISIGNKFVLLNTSMWKSESVKWDLWDGTVVSNVNALTHEFEWNDGSYDISLELKEWIKVEKKSFNIKKDVRNLIAARKKGLVIFSNQDIVENTISIADNKEKVFIYLGESKWDTVEQLTDFSIDTNTEYDSNLNWGKNDDKDMILSYGKDDSIVEIKLNDIRSQTIKIRAYDIDQTELYTQELLIVKEYIKDEEIDINSIEFKWVTQSELVTIEELKTEIKSLPKEYRLKSLMYVQKLQEEWFDVSEKTKIIVEFEWYISWIDSPNATTIYSLLEALLLEWEDDKSEKNLMFVALKNLTPTNIVCELSSDTQGGKCYNAIIERLELIKVNNDIDENKALAKEILEAIAIYPDMTNADKNNFKAILSSFIYGWVDNMPEQEKNDEIKKPNVDGPNDSGEENAIIWVLKTILYIFGIIIGLFALVFIIFFIIYKISNKNDHVGFQDFIIEKTSGHKKKVIVQKDDTEDILKELDADLWKKEEKIEITPENKKIENKDPLSSMDTKTLTWKVETSKEEVPEWLKGNFTEEVKEVEKDKSKEIPKNINNWENKSPQTKQSYTSKNNINNPDLEAKGNNKNVINDNKKSNNNKTEDRKSDWDIPDWLKWSFVEEKTEDKKELKQENVSQDSKKNTSNNISNTKIDNSQILKWSDSKGIETKVVETKNKSDDWDIPDWLKGAIDNKSKKVTQEKSEKLDSKEDDKKEESFTDKKDVPKMETKEDIDKVTEIKEEKEVKNTVIPDWLKGSLDENTSSKTADKKEKIEAKKSDNDIPDWLKGSLDEVWDTKTKDNISKAEEKIASENITTDKKILEEKVDSKKLVENKKEEEIKVTPVKQTEKSIKTETITKEVSEEKNVKISEVKEPKIEKKELKKSDNKNSEKNEWNTLKTPHSIKNDEKYIEKTQEKQVVKVIKPKTQKTSKPKTAVKVTTQTQQETKVENIITKEKKTQDELWDDGMKIPDWLKTEDDK